MTPEQIRAALDEIRAQRMPPALMPIYRLLARRDVGFLPARRCKLAADDVRLIRDLHTYHGMGYKRLARKFEVSPAYVQKICRGKRRVS